MGPGGDAARRNYVAVVGAGDADADTEAVAEAVGAELAARGAIVVCGGLGGVMEAACRGAKSRGGMTVGILPRLDRDEANPYVDIALPTGMGEARNTLVVRAADVVVAIGGEFGTLSEIAFALKVGTPVVGLSTWELAKAGQPLEPFARVATPHEAAEAALRLARADHGPPASA